MRYSLLVDAVTRAPMISVFIISFSGSQVAAAPGAVVACTAARHHPHADPFLCMHTTFLCMHTTAAGSARVVDGDTLYVGGEKVRLFAVDAPEKGQSCSRADGRPYACGEASASALSEHLKGGTVRCEVRSRDQYGRNVAACKLVGAASPAPVRQQQQQQSTSSNDIGNWLVSNGLAVAYKQYGKDYVASEQVAAAQRRGIWQVGGQPALCHMIP